MATSTLLCIHRDPARLSSLTEHGYELATATTGSDGLRLFMSRPVDTVVLEYHLGLLDGAATADEIKRVRPEVPIARRKVDSGVIWNQGWSWDFRCSSNCRPHTSF